MRSGLSAISDQIMELILQFKSLTLLEIERFILVLFIRFFGDAKRNCSKFSES